MELVKCEKKYWKFILDLRNKVKDSFLGTDEITFEEHELFMHKHNDNYFVCVEENAPIGFIGNVGKDVRIAVDPSNQKKGVGKFMLTSLLKNKKKFIAQIKITNEASLKLFESCGFTKKHVTLEN